MDGRSLDVWKLWFRTSLAASLLLFVVPLMFPAAHPWPFVLLNWIIFALGALIAERRTSAWPVREFRVATLAFAAAGLATFALSPTWP